MKKILIIDDEQAICTSLEFALEDEYDISTETDPQKGLEKLKEKEIDICLLDLKLGSVNGLDILAEIKEHHPSVIVIMMTAYSSIASSVEALEAGAYYYLTKPLRMEELRSIIKKAIHLLELNQQVEYLSKELESNINDKMIGKGPKMRNVFRMIDRVKQIDTNVLITGESGTGKELIVQAIHYSGNRKNNRLEVLNCSAIPEHLLESELFGHEEGAFTGASKSRKGKFELAQDGTIFLDEIGDMPLDLQAKLLRVLQEKEVTPIGASDAIKLNIRVVAATNKNLEEAIKTGEFREDLYYRLNVIKITLPPLRERREDIPLLIDYYLRTFNQELNRDISEISPQAMEWLLNYDYPGNIRELRNILESALVMSNGNKIELKDLNHQFYQQPEKNNDKKTAIENLVGLTLKEIEEKVILATLVANDNHRKNTAKMLGISERGLRGKLEKIE
ncbi:MAG TPA: sigma-54 dependent transcriptional regulator [Pseudogracilibacillus sp.]|nr:sigma-54 dependent transcriptional regulator [Pseudogracilibacillus sp.]